LAVAKSVYVYAQGKLVFVSNIEVPGACKDVLVSARLKKLAIANYKIAPYGLAARQVLQKFSLWDRLSPHLVMGENILQTFQFVSTKNADAGFIAAAIFHMGRKIDMACAWFVPATLHSPINQKMLVLNRSKNKAPVKSFAQYMRSAAAKKIIQAMGYDVPSL